MFCTVGKKNVDTVTFCKRVLEPESKKMQAAVADFYKATATC